MRSPRVSWLSGSAAATMLAATVACAPVSRTTPTSQRTAGPPVAESFAAETFSWLVGHWERPGASEHWLRARSGLWGVRFTFENAKTTHFDVLTVAATPRGKQLVTIADGTAETTLGLVAAGALSAEFADAAATTVGRIRYQRTGDRLHTQTETPATAGPQDLEWTRAVGVRADALDAADRAFAADTGARGVDGWAAAFESGGAMWSQRRKTRIEGAEIRAAMAPVFASGTRIEWDPIASALSPAGDIGYTVGLSRFIERKPSGAMVIGHEGSYVTVWRRQTNGAWKVLFDTGN